MPKWLPALALLFAAFALTGCRTPAPQLRVVGAELTEQTADGVAMAFTVSAENLGREPLPLQDVEYTVALNGRPVFAGLRSAEVILNRYGTQTFSLPAVITASEREDLSGPTAQYSISGRVTYIVPGALAETLFDIRVFRPSTGFSGQGLLRLDPPRPTAPRDPSAPGPSPD